MKVEDVVCVSACRTAMGRFGGRLRDFKVFKLGSLAMAESLRRVGISGDMVDEVVVGHCRQAGNGPNPAKIASGLAGIPNTVHALTINNACPLG